MIYDKIESSKVQKFGRSHGPKSVAMSTSDVFKLQLHCMTTESHAELSIKSNLHTKTGIALSQTDIFLYSCPCGAAFKIYSVNHMAKHSFEPDRSTSKYAHERRRPVHTRYDYC
jgi:hypothetical protein